MLISSFEKSYNKVFHLNVCKLVWQVHFALPSSRAYALWTSNTPFIADYKAINLHVVNDIECLGTESDRVSHKNTHKVSI